MYKIKLLNLRIIRETPDWESLAQHSKIVQMCAFYKAFTGERVWKAIGDRLQAPSYLSKVDHCWKIRARKQRTDIRKYSFVNLHCASWHCSATLTEVFPCLFLSCKANARVKPTDGTARTLPKLLCSVYCFVSFCVLCV